MESASNWQPFTLRPDDFSVAPNLSGLCQVGAVAARLLERHKAVRFSGFSVAPDEFGPAAECLLPHRLSYTHGNTPRSHLGDNIYTSTEYAADQPISMHSELSYTHRWPRLLLFYCARPARAGGATCLADTTDWLSRIDPEVRLAFAGGLRYTQNLHDGAGLGKSWQDTFETDDPATVESFLAESGAEWSWTRTGLTISQVRPSTIRHPGSGAEVWFNQVDQWHTAGLPGDVRAALLDLLGEDELPQHATFPDGAAIPDDYVLHVRDEGWRGARDIDWQPGELLLVDNVAAAHARRPYAGSRRVLVAMSN